MTFATSMVSYYRMSGYIGKIMDGMNRYVRSIRIGYGRWESSQYRIWDAINENWDSYIGNTLIPKLKELDPTRIWDAGYMHQIRWGRTMRWMSHTLIVRLR